MTECIICRSNNNQPTIEHIVPKSLGNTHYILRKGLVCKPCNQRFARYEHRTLNSTDWVQSRIKNGLLKFDNNQSPLETKESDVARFLLKIFYESIYKSRRKLLHQHNLEGVRNELLGSKVLDYRIEKGKDLTYKKSIPRGLDKWRLRINKTELSYRITDDEIYFLFRYDSLYNIISFSCR